MKNTCSNCGRSGDDVPLEAEVICKVRFVLCPYCRNHYSDMLTEGLCWDDDDEDDDKEDDDFEFGYAAVYDGLTKRGDTRDAERLFRR